MPRKTIAQLEKENKESGRLIEMYCKQLSDMRNTIQELDRARKGDFADIADARSKIEKLTEQRDAARASRDCLEDENHGLRSWKEGATFFGFSIRAALLAGADTERRKKHEENDELEAGRR